MGVLYTWVNLNRFADFVVWTRVGRWNHVLGGSLDPQEKEQFLEGATPLWCGLLSKFFDHLLTSVQLRRFIPAPNVLRCATGRNISVLEDSWGRDWNVVDDVATLQSSSSSILISGTEAHKTRQTHKVQLMCSMDRGRNPCRISG